MTQGLCFNRSRLVELWQIKEEVSAEQGSSRASEFALVLWPFWRAKASGRGEDVILPEKLDNT